MTKFIDTNILLSHLDALENEKLFLISSVSIQELEEIKTSSKKTDELRYNARKAVRWLNDNPEKYKVIIYDGEVRNFNDHILDETHDVQIMECAAYAKLAMGYQDLVFITDDVLCRLIAKEYFGLTVDGVDIENVDEYHGFTEKTLSESEMAWFYEHITENIYGLITNEYLVIKNENYEIVDTYRWNGEEYQNVKYPTIKSNLFGSVKPYNGDIYQQMVLNSLSVNQITMIKGPAGTGKSYLAIGYMLWLLEKHKIDKIVIFANPTPTANSARIGFLPGTQLDKLIDSSIGNMLSGKLGDKYEIEQLISQNKLSILPMCDIRGFDTTGLNCAVYITEAQNMDISLMKLALQRIGEDSICIIDGDYNTQVDSGSYAGSNNGMRRMSEVFRGQDFYGEIELQNIYRSKIAKIAELM